MDLTRGQKLLVLLGLLGILLALILLSLNHARQSRAPLSVEYVAPPAEAAPHYLAVHVVGAVNRPGIYWLPPQSRVSEAVAQAGGLRPDADPASVNLAAFVEDGQQIVVRQAEAGTTPAPPQTVSNQPPPPPAPAQPAAGQAPPPPSQPPAPPLMQARPVSLSRATQAELESLPGIGPSLALAILYYRQEHGAFRNVSDLTNVPGFGKERVEALRPYVVP
jgi:competence protein ComEA